MKRQDFIKELKETLGGGYKVTIVAPSKNSLKVDYPTYILMVTTIELNDIVYTGNVVCKRDNSIYFIENVTIRPASCSNDTIIAILNLINKIK